MFYLGTFLYKLNIYFFSCHSLITISLQWSPPPCRIYLIWPWWTRKQRNWISTYLRLCSPRWTYCSGMAWSSWRILAAALKRQHNKHVGLTPGWAFCVFRIFMCPLTIFSKHFLSHYHPKLIILDPSGCFPCGFLLNFV